MRAEPPPEEVPQILSSRPSEFLLIVTSMVPRSAGVLLSPRHTRCLDPVGGAPRMWHHFSLWNTLTALLNSVELGMRIFLSWA